MLEAVAVSLSRSAVPDAPTLNALLGTIPVCSKGTCERGVMKTLATTLLNPVIGASSSSKVLRPCDRFKMVGVNAVSGPTKMIKVYGPVKLSMLSHVKRSVGKLSPINDPAELGR